MAMMGGETGIDVLVGDVGIVAVWVLHFTMLASAEAGTRVATQVPLWRQIHSCADVRGLVRVLTARSEVLRNSARYHPRQSRLQQLQRRQSSRFGRSACSRLPATPDTPDTPDKTSYTLCRTRQCSTMTDEMMEKARNRVEIAKSFAGEDASPRVLWAVLHYQFLSPSMPFDVHRLAHQIVYEGCTDERIRAAWIPSREHKVASNIYKMMQTLPDVDGYEHFYRWSIQHREDFWMESAKRIGVQWDAQPTKVFAYDNNNNNNVATSYFPDGRLNIAKSCFPLDDSDTAIVFATEAAPKELRRWTSKRLRQIANRVSTSLSSLNMQKGDAVAICMPMTPESVAIYLGIVQAGCTVVCIPDSFAPESIAMRCRLGQAKCVFTQDVIHRVESAEKALPLFARVLQAQQLLHQENSQSPFPAIVLPARLHGKSTAPPQDKGEDDSGEDEDGDAAYMASLEEAALHDSVGDMMRSDLDVAWKDFLQSPSTSVEYEPVVCSSLDPCTILFSSGTTGEPKAIVWSHSTPIKCAVDGHYHQDIKKGDIAAWPTNIGWMMGPWLIYQLINGATLALFNGAASTPQFCQFVAESKITMLGVIPSLVRAWKANDCLKDCAWSRIQRFTSTGEASDANTYLWLMSRISEYAPVIEYCGGTEIGGSFLSSTMMQPNVPGMFSTPVLGSQLWLLQDDGSGDGTKMSVNTDSAFLPAENANDQTAESAGNTIITGEIALVPPSVGMSTTLLNRDHDSTYYAGMPQGPDAERLRRHGDVFELIRAKDPSWGSYYRAVGRCDDTMNLGGIKVGSIEIERVCNHLVQESAAIAISSSGAGPSSLVMYVVANDADKDKDELQERLQESIKTKLNPLFVLSDVVIVDELPRTASNKVMRRTLRDMYSKR